MHQGNAAPPNPPQGVQGYPGQPMPPGQVMPVGATVPLVEDPRMVELEKERAATRSKAAALGIAVLAHALIFAVLALIVIAAVNNDPPELIVESTGADDTPKITKNDFAKKISNEKPSPPSHVSSQMITSSTPSAVTVPMVEDITEDPVIGDSTDGDGFGGGGFGDGGGGAKFFGTPGGGNNIVIVIDTSTSMIPNCGRDGCDAIIKEVNRTVSALKKGTRFNIICFGNDADAITEKGLSVSPASQATAKKFMKDYFQNKDWTRTRTAKFGKKGKDNKGIAYHPIMPDDIKSLSGTSGGSRMDLALVAAFNQKPKTIFLIADGEPGTRRGNKKLDQKDLVKLLRDEAKRAYNGGTLPTVHAISVKDHGEKMLRAIAKEFRGKYKSIDPAKA